MPKQHLMQARDSISGTMYRWISAVADWVGAGYPGPNDAEEIAVVAEAEASSLGHNAQTGTAYTLTLSDAQREVLSFTNASPVLVTVPNDATVALPANLILPVYAGGAGLVTFAATAPATIESADGLLSLRTLGSAGMLWKRGANDWVLSGDLA